MPHAHANQCTVKTADGSQVCLPSDSPSFWKRDAHRGSVDHSVISSMLGSRRTEALSFGKWFARFRSRRCNVAASTLKPRAPLDGGSASHNSLTTRPKGMRLAQHMVFNYLLPLFLWWSTGKRESATGDWGQCGVAHGIFLSFASHSIASNSNHTDPSVNRTGQ